MGNPRLCAASERLRATPERRISSRPEGPRNVYVFQREYATVDPARVESALSFSVKFHSSWAVADAPHHQHLSPASALPAVRVGPSPIGKVAQLYLDLQATATSSQNEVTKSKRPTELLLAELNEAHERADNLQEELVMAEAALSESSKQNNVLESARADAVRHLEHITYMQAQAARKQIDHLKELNSTSGQLREVCFELSQHLVSAFSKDVDVICYMESFMKSYGKWMDGTNMVDIPITSNQM
ncbi:hypothetical protein ACQ4PT_026100 [Festuca glaucescens]